MRVGLSLLFLCLVLGLSAVCGQRIAYEYVDVDGFEVMGGKGGPGFGFGGPLGHKGGSVSYVQPVVQQLVAAPVLQAPVEAPAPQKSVRYAQPIVTYAQPIVQQVDMTAPAVSKQSLTAEPIVQPTFQTAPLQTTQAITSTAPTIQKGFGSGLGLGGAGGY